ncbi:hypothetical protein NHX12_022317 [Muraenolepis orangiensis]|uniref:Kinase non-catalytic C-lobe domain-containing protein 1 n=1 Tax=Muraenolepis orangiensis TaxID=630683 RepID=A0A9Q0EPM6_9TELE|nr:hypothetical protein NHX12_022317 [Muraenolepis orangiensis]
METFATDSAAKYLGRDGRRGYSELEHLPPLLEDEENVSLADVLSLRDSCLTEEEVWAMSGECVLALRSIQPTQLFHSLCITPDTLAFNAHGNVCFMEQLSDDVERSFVPPEFDHTGSTFEGHVFSLGSTLSAALDFVIEPELQAELGEDALRLLELMQAELPDDRPRPQDILAQAEEKLAHTSSCGVCRKLSSVGRRVLSLESKPGSEDRAVLSAAVDADGRPLRRWQAYDSPWDPHLWAACMEDDGSVPVQEPDLRSGPHGRRGGTAWSRRLRRPLDRGQSCECYLASGEYTADPSTDRRANNQNGAGGECVCAPLGDDGEEERDRAAVGDGDEADGGGGPLDGPGPYVPDNHMTKSMLCLNEETQDEWISLRELLPRWGRRLRVNELWALCHTCLTTLQTYIDFPAYLCLDTVYVGCEGEVLFLKPKNIGSCDAFYLAPEYQEHGIVTEKACVYGVAAILWAAAKFGLSPNRKLAMPRQLKRLLLEMARRTPMERPSIVTAQKSCRDYLSCQGTSAETVWTLLIDAIHQQHSHKSTAPEGPDKADLCPTSAERSPAHITSGFVPLATESRLAPVHGPVPRSYPTSMLQLPEAFTSTATHFSPIVLTQEDHSEEEGNPKPGAHVDGTMEFARNGVTGPKQEGGLDITSRCENVSLTRTFVTHLDVAVLLPDGRADQTDTNTVRGQSSGLLNSLSVPSDTSQRGTMVSLPAAYAAYAYLSRFKSYLLCQDTTAGRLTLVPVGFTPFTTSSDSLRSQKISESPRLSPRQQQQTVCSTANTAGPVDGLTGSVSPDPPLQIVGPRDRHGELTGSGSRSSDGSWVDRLCPWIYRLGPWVSQLGPWVSLLGPWSTSWVPVSTDWVPGSTSWVPGSTSWVPGSTYWVPGSPGWVPGSTSWVPASTSSVPGTTGWVPGSPSWVPGSISWVPGSTGWVPGSTGWVPVSTAGSLGLPAGSLDLLAGSLGLPAGSLDLPAGSLGLLAGSLGLPAGSLGLPAGSLDLPAQSLGLPAGSLGLQAGSLGLPARSLGLPAGSLGLPAGSLGLPAGSLGLPAGSLGLPAGSLSLPAGSLGLPAGSLGLPAGSTQEMDGEPALCHYLHPALQEAIADLLKGEFDNKTSVENDQEELAMGIGEYVFSLKDLQYQSFARLVREGFSHLYWEEDLLGVLHCLVSSTQVIRSAVQTSGGRASTLHGLLDVNGNLPFTEPFIGTGTTMSRLMDPEPTRFDGRPDDIRQAVSSGRELPMETEVTQGGERLTGGGCESPAFEDHSPWGRRGGGGGPGGLVSGEGRAGASSPGCSDDMEDDGDSLCSSERRVSPYGSGAWGAPEQGSESDPSWALAYYGDECFGAEVMHYAQSLGQHSGSACLDVKAQELQQQLVIENRNLKKTRNFYQKLLQQDRKNKGSESKLMLGKLKTQLEEVKSKVEFLYSVKKYLEVLIVDQWGLEVTLLPALADHHLSSVERPDPADPTVLSFGPQTGHCRSTLQAGTPRGLLAHLYARNVALDGYVQQLLYTYRYFCTSEQLLSFLMDRFSTATRGPDLSGNNVKILHRTLHLLEAWLIDCKTVDLTPNGSLLSTLENFLNSEVIPVDSRAETLLATLHSPPGKRRIQGSERPISIQAQDEDSLSMQSPVEEAEKRHWGPWRMSSVVEPRDRDFCIAAALPVPCFGSLLGDLSGGSPRAQDRFLLPFSQTEGASLFAGEETSPSDSVLQRLLAFADSVTNWISAEIVSSDSSKAQAALLTRFLLIGKHCYESRDFATAMQVLAGLENVIVRQLPAWKHLSSKVCDVLEELRAVQVFLKSDDLCLMGGEQAWARRPTLPSARILAMHVQQLERGGFTLTTGAYKWTKLRGIARVVSQVQAFQEAAFPYSPERELQAYLRGRVQHLSGCDLHLLAADNHANFRQTPSTRRHVRHIQDTLRRVRANFQ